MAGISHPDYQGRVPCPYCGSTDCVGLYGESNNLELICIKTRKILTDTIVENYVRHLNQKNSIETHDTDSEQFHTTGDFWDCACDTDFIRPGYEKQCRLCGMDRDLDGMPDARIEEIVENLNHSEKSRRVLHNLVEDLLTLGFDWDGEINGADTVDVINEYFPSLKRLAGIRGGRK